MDPGAERLRRGRLTGVAWGGRAGELIEDAGDRAFE